VVDKMDLDTVSVYLDSTIANKIKYAGGKKLEKKSWREVKMNW
jgi:hypothetical protein